MNGQRRKIPRNILILGFVALASGFGQDLITPVLPAYLVLLGLSHADVGLIDGLLQGSTSLFRFVSGLLSDKFKKRKQFVFLGYALSSVARPLLALAGSLPAIAALRTVDGIGKGTKDAPRDALVADSAQAGAMGRAFGFHRLVDTAGSVFGPLSAGLILLSLAPSLSSYRLIFWLAAIPGAIALALIFFGVREPAFAEKPQAAVGRALPWQFWIFTIGTTVAMLSKINDSLFLLRSQDLGVPSSYVPILFAGFTLVYALAAYPIGVWSDKVGRMPLIAGGWLLLSMIEILFAYDTTLRMALVLFAGYGLFYALTEGSGRALIADLVPSQNRGRAYAFYHTLVGLAVIAGGFFLGRIWDLISFKLAFQVSSAGSLLAFLILLFLIIKSPKLLSPRS